MDFDKQVIIGIDQNNELISVGLNFHDLNRGTKFENDHYYLSWYGYYDLVDSETGEEKAKERLSDSDYWEEIGYLNDNIPGVLRNNIDFESLAEDVLSSDGWEMTNGEYYYFDDLDGKQYYFNCGRIGYSDEEKKEDNFSKFFITEEEFDFITSFKEVKPQDKDKIDLFYKIVNAQNRQEIIKCFLEAQN